MRKHLSKKIAPVIVAICLISYYIMVAIFLIKVNLSNIVQIIAIIVSIIMTIVIIAVLVERIKEINEGEEDDLGKY